MNNPDVYFVDCSCHIAHNAARKWGDSFSGSSGFDVEDSRKWGDSFSGSSGFDVEDSRKWGDSFSGSSGFDVEDLVVDLYYWFDKSTKRKNELKEFCVFNGNTLKHVLRHASTRWQKCVYRGILEGISNSIKCFIM